MRIITTAVLASGLVLGTAGLAHAQLGGLLGGDKATGSVLGQAGGVVTGQSSSGVLGQAPGVLGNGIGSGIGSSAPGSLTSSTLSGSETITAGKVILGGGSTTDAAVAVGRSRVNSQISGITGGSTGSSPLSGITSEGASGGLPGVISGGSSSGLGGLVGGGSSSGLGGLVGGGSSSGLGAITGGGTSSGLGGIVGGGSGFLGRPVDFPVDNSGTATTAVPAISCPSGTTAQGDGTCMITGNYGS